MKKKNKLSDDQILNILREYSKSLVLTQKEVKLNTDIVDVKFIGRKIEQMEMIDGSKEEFTKYLFIVEKEMDDVNSKAKGARVTRKEFYEETDLIGIDDKYRGIIPEMTHLEEKDIQEKIDMMSEMEVEGKSLVQLEDDRLKKLAKTLKKKPEELKSVAEINTDNKILSPDEINAKTEINLNQKITQTETFADIVPGAEKYQKVVVTYSENIEGGNGKFSFVGIDKDGNQEVLDSLIPTQGTNPTNEVVTINHNGDNVEQEQVSSMYSVKGRPDEGFTFKLDEYGIPKVSYLRGIKSKEYLAGQVQTTNLKPTTLEVKNMMDKTKNTSVIDEVGKAKKEIDFYDKTNIYNIDENPDNDIDIDI